MARIRYYAAPPSLLAIGLVGRSPGDGASTDGDDGTDTANS